MPHDVIPLTELYSSSPVGVSPKPENCVFVPIPVELRFSQQERSGREFSEHYLLFSPLIDLQLLVVDLLSNVASGSSDAFPATDLDILERALESVTEMLDRVLSYVRSVLAGEVKGDAAVGRYLFDTFGASTEELEKGAFNSSLQVMHVPCPPECLLISAFSRTLSWFLTSQTWFAHKRKFPLVWL